jgi:hypothetical protein
MDKLLGLRLRWDVMGLQNTVDNGNLGSRNLVHSDITRLVTF